MPDPVRFAILGPGVVAEFHQKAIAANADHGAELAAIAHYDPDRFDDLSAQFGVPCRSEEAVLADPAIDAIILCTPSGQHAEQAIAAAEAGKHVLVEKPIAVTTADADRMIAAADQAGVKLGVVFQRRAEPLFRQMHEAIAGGDLGDLTLGVVTMPYFRSQDYYDSGAWRGTWALDGGGVLMNQGIHIIDLLVWYMGDPVDVLALGGTLQRDIEVEDAMVASLRFASGAIGTITGTTTAAPGFAHHLGVFGTGGGIQVEGEQVTHWQLADPAQATVPPIEPGGSSDAGAGGDPRGIALTGHIGIIRDFVAAIRDDRAPLIDGREGRRSLAAIEAIYRAAGIRS